MSSYWSFPVILDVACNYSYNTRFGGGTEDGEYRGQWMIQRWIADNVDRENMKFILHAGDVMAFQRFGPNNPPLGNPHTAEQISSMKSCADNANQLLVDTGLPLLVSTGNHDYEEFVWPNIVGWTPSIASDLNDTVLDSSRYESESYFGGAKDTGAIDNVYFEMTIDGRDYLLIAVECYADAAARTWASGIIDLYPNHFVILLAHDLLYGGAIQAHLSTNGQYIWDDVIDSKPNQFFATCGHIIDTIPSMLSQVTSGAIANMYIGNHQYHEGNYSHTTALLVKVYDDNTATIDHYSPSLGRYLTEYQTHTFTWDKET